MFKSKYIIGIALAAAVLTGFNSCADLDLEPLGSPEAGEISEEQLSDYAVRRNLPVDEVRALLNRNL